MTICAYCKQKMGTNDSCTHNALRYKNEITIRNSTHFEGKERCRDCGIKNEIGNYHHFSCNVELCPKCDKILIHCTHFFDVDDEPEIIQIEI